MDGPPSKETKSSSDHSWEFIKKITARAEHACIRAAKNFSDTQQSCADYLQTQAYVPYTLIHR